MAEFITSCGRQPSFGDLLGFDERRMAMTTGSYGKAVGEAVQVARRNLMTGYLGRTGNFNSSAADNRSQPLLFEAFEARDIICSIAPTS